MVLSHLPFCNLNSNEIRKRLIRQVSDFVRKAVTDAGCGERKLWARLGHLNLFVG